MCPQAQMVLLRLAMIKVSIAKVMLVTLLWMPIHS